MQRRAPRWEMPVPPARFRVEAVFLFAGLLALASLTTQIPRLASVFAAIGVAMPAAARWLVALHVLCVPQTITVLLVVIALGVEWSLRDPRRKSRVNVAMAVAVFILLAFFVFAFWTPLEALLTRG